MPSGSILRDSPKRTISRRIALWLATVADLLLVRGNALQDVSILRHQDSFAVIIKDGVVHKMARASGRPAR